MAGTSNVPATRLLEGGMLSDYATDLDHTAKARYLEKLELPRSHEDGPKYLPDPYKLPSGWTDDPRKWPDLGFGDIYCYLVESPGMFTKNSLKAYKSLEAYRFVVSGHVQAVQYNAIADDIEYCALKTKVIPSQKIREKPHQPWVYLHKETASVLCAHCTCMAGLGEVCSHVAALLFKVEMGVHLGLSSVSSTSEACQWNKTFRKELNPMTISDLQHTIGGKRTKPVQSVLATGKDPLPESEILVSLKEVCPSAVFFTTIPPLDPEETDTASESGEGTHEVIRPLRDLFDKDAPVDKAELETYIEQTWVKYKCSEQQCKELEDRTRGQAVCPLWFEQRKGRITGSRAHDVLTLRDTTNPENLTKRITGSKCYYLSGKQAIKWGRVNEDRARGKYANIQRDVHVEFQLKSTGLRVDPERPFLAASADGIASCGCCAQRVLEIKCPYKYRDCKISEACTDKCFCLNSNSELKRGHKYFTQVQLQMYVHNVDFCDFFIYTNVDHLLLSVKKDSDFCQSLVQKSGCFFHKHILPELVTRRLEEGGTESEADLQTDQNEEQLWCLCGEPEYGKMIKCDQSDCPTQWFHFECVNVRRCPRGKWFCPRCQN